MKKIIELGIFILFLIVLSSFVFAVDGKCTINIGSCSFGVDVLENLDISKTYDCNNEKIEAGSQITFEIKNCESVSFGKLFFDGGGAFGIYGPDERYTYYFEQVISAKLGDSVNLLTNFPSLGYISSSDLRNYNIYVYLEHDNQLHSTFVNILPGFKIVDTKAPVANVQETMQCSVIGDVSFDCTASDATQLKYQWDYGDGSLPGFENTRCSDSHFYEKGKEYTATVTVKDAANNIATKNVKIKCGVKEITSRFTASYTPIGESTVYCKTWEGCKEISITKGTTVTYTDNSLGTGLSYKWYTKNPSSFFTGAPTHTNKEITVTYNEPGDKLYYDGLKIVKDGIEDISYITVLVDDPGVDTCSNKPKINCNLPCFWCGFNNGNCRENVNKCSNCGEHGQIACGDVNLKCKTGFLTNNYCCSKEETWIGKCVIVIPTAVICKSDSDCKSGESCLEDGRCHLKNIEDWKCKESDWPDRICDKEKGICYVNPDYNNPNVKSECIASSQKKDECKDENTVIEYSCGNGCESKEVECKENEKCEEEKCVREEEINPGIHFRSEEEKQKLQFLEKEPYFQYMQEYTKEHGLEVTFGIMESNEMDLGIVKIKTNGHIQHYKDNPKKLLMEYTEEAINKKSTSYHELLHVKHYIERGFKDVTELGYKLYLEEIATCYETLDYLSKTVIGTENEYEIANQLLYLDQNVGTYYYIKYSLTRSSIKSTFIPNKEGKEIHFIIFEPDRKKDTEDIQVDTLSRLANIQYKGIGEDGASTQITKEMGVCSVDLDYYKEDLDWKVEEDGEKITILDNGLLSFNPHIKEAKGVLIGEDTEGNIVYSDVSVTDYENIQVAYEEYLKEQDKNVLAKALSKVISLFKFFEDKKDYGGVVCEEIKTGYIVGHNKLLETTGEKNYNWYVVDKGGNPIYNYEVDETLTEENKEFIENILKKSIIYSKINNLPYPIYIAFGNPKFGGAITLTDLQNRFSEILFFHYYLEPNSNWLINQITGMEATQEQLIRSILTHESVHTYFSYKYNGIEKYDNFDQNLEEGTAYAIQLLELIKMGLEKTKLFDTYKTSMMNHLSSPNFFDENHQNIIVNEETIKKTLKEKLSPADYKFFFEEEGKEFDTININGISIKRYGRAINLPYDKDSSIYLIAETIKQLNEDLLQYEDITEFEIYDLKLPEIHGPCSAKAWYIDYGCFNLYENEEDNKLFVKDIITHELAHEFYSKYIDLKELDPSLYSLFEKYYNLCHDDKIVDMNNIKFDIVSDCSYQPQCNIFKGGHPWETENEFHSTIFMIYRNHADEFVNVIKGVKDENIRNTLKQKNIINLFDDKDVLYNLLVDIWKWLRNNEFNGKVFTSDGINPFECESYKDCGEGKTCEDGECVVCEQPAESTLGKIAQWLGKTAGVTVLCPIEGVEKKVEELLNHPIIKPLYNTYGNKLIKVLNHYVKLKKSDEQIISYFENYEFDYINDAVNIYLVLATDDLKSLVDNLKDNDLAIDYYTSGEYSLREYYADKFMGSINSYQQESDPIMDDITPYVNFVLKNRKFEKIEEVYSKLRNGDILVNILVEELSDENIGGYVGFCLGNNIISYLERNKELEKGKQIIKNLIPLLSDDQKGFNAAWAIGGGMYNLDNYPDISKQILDLLKDNNKNVRGNAARAVFLMIINYNVKVIDEKNILFNSIIPLVDLLQDKDIGELQRKTAIEALEEITKKVSTPVTNSHPLYQAIQPLIDLFDNDAFFPNALFQYTGQQAAYALSEIIIRLEDNEATINDLIELTKTEDKGGNAALALHSAFGKIDNIDAFAFKLIDLLNHEVAGSYSVLALGGSINKVKDKNGVLIKLIDFLNNDISKVRAGFLIGEMVKGLEQDYVINEGDNLYNIIDVLIHSFDTKKASAILPSVLADIVIRLNEENKMNVIIRLINDLVNQVNSRDEIAESLNLIGDKFVHEKLAELIKNKKIESLEFMTLYSSSMKPETTLIYLLSIPKFNEIYYNKKISDKPQWERNSIALATFRLLKRDTSYNTNSALDYILDKREKFSIKEILGANTNLLAFAHIDDNLQNDPIKEFAKIRGVSKIYQDDLKGPEDKEKIEDAIKNWNKNEKTTIWVNAHGLPNYVCLGGGIPNQPTIEQDELSCNGFRYDKFADLLLERGNLDKVTIVIESCYGYNFADQLLKNLESKSSKSYPTIITAANVGRTAKMVSAFGIIGQTYFLGSLLKLSYEGPLLGKHIYQAEEFTFEVEDTAVFFSEDVSSRPIELAMNTLNHYCGSEECIGDMCPVG